MADFPLTLPDANVQVWDAWSWFGQMLDNAEAFGFKNSSTCVVRSIHSSRERRLIRLCSWCSAYSHLKWNYADVPDQDKPECGVRVRRETFALTSSLLS